MNLKKMRHNSWMDDIWQSIDNISVKCHHSLVRIQNDTTYRLIAGDQEFISRACERSHKCNYIHKKYHYDRCQGGSQYGTTFYHYNCMPHTRHIFKYD